MQRVDHDEGESSKITQMLRSVDVIIILLEVSVQNGFQLINIDERSALYFFVMQSTKDKVSTLVYYVSLFYVLYRVFRNMKFPKLNFLKEISTQIYLFFVMTNRSILAADVKDI